MVMCAKALKLFFDILAVGDEDVQERKWIEIDEHAASCETCHAWLEGFEEGMKEGKKLHEEFRTVAHSAD